MALQPLLILFSHFSPEVPETPHIAANPRVSGYGGC